MSVRKAILLMFLIACSLLAPLALAQTQTKNPDTTAILVKTAEVKSTNLPQTVTALGSLSAPHTAVISAQANAEVSAIDFKDGQQVSKGMPIIQLNNTQARANYAKAVSAYQVAKQKYQRSKLLLNTAVSQQDLASLKADVDSKEAGVKDAAAVLNQLKVVAPFSGVLGAFQVKVGDYVQQGEQMVTLVNTQRLQVDFNVPENLLAKLKQGQSVKIKVAAYPHKVFYGTVTYVAPMINSDTRSVAIEALVSNKNHLLSPGMFVHVSQQIGVIKNALVIPSIALMADVKGYYVYKIVKNKAEKIYVSVGERLPGKVQITKGLKAGEVIVTSGQQKLQDGSVVKK